jgi:hypothetical protein
MERWKEGSKEHDTSLNSKPEYPQRGDVLSVPSMFRIGAGNASWSRDVDLFASI